MEYNIDAEKQIENTVCNLFNKHILHRRKFKLIENDKSVFDFAGRDEFNKPILVEVKSRTKLFKYPFIEIAKAMNMFKEGKKNHNGDTEYYYVLSTDGIHRVYNIKDLWILGKHTKGKFNKNTTESRTNKKDKEIISFHYESYAFIINDDGVIIGDKYQKTEQYEN